MKKGLFALALMSALVAQAEDTEGSVLSTNTFGVLRVSSSYTNTIIAVPWTDYSADSNPDPIMATNMVRVANLKEGDTMLVYSGGQYNAWKVVVTTSGVKEWVPEKMWSSTKPFGPSDSSKLTDAQNQVVRGKAFWLHRDGVSAREDKDIFLYGQMATGDVNVSVGAGSTLIANPFPEELSLNGGKFSLISGDIYRDSGNYTNGDAIVIPNDSDAPKMAYYDGEKWYINGKSQYDPSTHKITAQKITDIKIPGGTGFWYVRRGVGNIEFKFSKSGN